MRHPEIAVGAALVAVTALISAFITVPEEQMMADGLKDQKLFVEYEAQRQYDAGVAEEDRLQREHSTKLKMAREAEEAKKRQQEEERAREAARAQRSQQRSAPAVNTGSYANTLACIRKHESGNSYTRVSKTGKFRGAYMMHRGYAPEWARRAGYGDWAGTAVDRWPPSVQDAVALHLGKGSNWRAWSDHVSYSCPRFIS